MFFFFSRIKWLVLKAGDTSDSWNSSLIRFMVVHVLVEVSVIK